MPKDTLDVGQKHAGVRPLESSSTGEILASISKSCSDIMSFASISDIPTFNRRLDYIIGFLESGKPDLAEKLYYIFKRDLIVGIISQGFKYNNSITDTNPIGIQDKINEVFERIFGKRCDATLDSFFVHYCQGVYIPSMKAVEFNVDFLLGAKSEDFCKRVDLFFPRIF